MKFAGVESAQQQAPWSRFLSALVTGARGFYPIKERVMCSLLCGGTVLTDITTRIIALL